MIPLADGDRIVAQRVWGNTVDDTMPDQYRYLAIAGPADHTRDALIAEEAATMRRKGWILRDSGNTVLDKRVKQVAVTAPGARVDLDNPHRSAWAVLATAGTVQEATNVNLLPLLHLAGQTGSAAAPTGADGDFRRRRRPLTPEVAGTAIDLGWPDDVVVDTTAESACRLDPTFTDSDCYAHCRRADSD